MSLQLFFVSILPFTAAFFSFILMWDHLLMTLLTLELMALSSFLVLLTFSSILTKDLFVSFFFLGVVVCEGALGLSMLIIYSWVKGSDLLAIKTILKW